MDVDAQILKSILQSTDVPEEFKSTKQWKSIEECKDSFPVVDDEVIDLLSKSFADHLSVKVSEEAYQRYSVRQQLIGVLRDWCRIDSNIEFPSFLQDGKKAVDFFLGILLRHLRSENLRDLVDMDKLVQSANILMKLAKKLHELRPGFKKVVLRILQLKKTDDTEQFFKDLLKEANNLELDSSFTDQIYYSQCQTLVENPLERTFTLCLTDPSNADFGELQILMSHAVESSSLFYLICLKLKDLFIVTNHDRCTIDFIQKVLEKIEFLCTERKKAMINLYPTELQHCVFLLKISPKNHSSESKSYTLESLRQTFIYNHNNALVLLSQNPDWYQLFTTYLEELEKN